MTDIYGYKMLPVTFESCVKELAVRRGITYSAVEFFICPICMKETAKTLIPDFYTCSPKFSCRFCGTHFLHYNENKFRGLYMKEKEIPKLQIKTKTGRGVYPFNLDLYDSQMARISRFSGFAVVFLEEDLGSSYVRISLGLVTGFPESLLEEARERIPLVMHESWIKWEYKEDV